MAQKLSQLPKEVWDASLKQADALYEKTLKLDADCKYEEPKPLDESNGSVMVQYGTLSTEKLKTAKGSVTCQGNILDGIAYDVGFGEITPEMPKNERHGKLCKFMYFQNEASEAYFKNKKLDEVKEDIYFYYQVNEINVPLVSNREFAAIRIIKILEKEPKLKVRIVTASPEIDFDFGTKNVQRAIIHNYNEYEQIDDNSFKVTQFFYCNPMGKIAPAIFNKTLSNQLTFLSAIKKHIENK